MPTVKLNEGFFAAQESLPKGTPIIVVTASRLSANKNAEEQIRKYYHGLKKLQHKAGTTTETLFSSKNVQPVLAPSTEHWTGFGFVQWPSAEAQLSVLRTPAFQELAVYRENALEDSRVLTSAEGIASPVVAVESDHQPLTLAKGFNVTLTGPVFALHLSRVSNSEEAARYFDALKQAAADHKGSVVQDLPCSVTSLAPASEAWNHIHLLRFASPQDAAAFINDRFTDEGSVGSLRAAALADCRLFLATEAEPEQELTDAEEAMKAKVEQAEKELAAIEANLVRLDEHEAQVKAKQEIIDAKQCEVNDVSEKLRVAQKKVDELQAFLLQAGNLDALERQLASLEDAAAGESLQHLWHTLVQEQDLAKADREQLVVRDMIQRVVSSASKHQEWHQRANEMLAKAEQEKSVAQASKDEVIKGLDEQFEKEKTSLGETRKQLKTVENEQLFHIKRGTYIKEPPAARVRDIEREKQNDLYNQTCSEIVEEKKRLVTLNDDVRALRKDLDKLKTDGDAERAEVSQKIDEARGIAEEMEWEKELLVLERDDLAAVKKEIVAVTAAVKRQRNQ